MYQAEIRSKLSPKQENMEDLLTSNVFSFFKYTNRGVFLKKYLDLLGFDVSGNAAREAEFIFWPKYDDRTEPDLVILVGDHYLLFEAKYFSGFGEETPELDAQPVREIREGKLDAENIGKRYFSFIAITADSCRPENKLACIPEEQMSCVAWTNWQAISSMLQDILEDPKDLNSGEELFAADLIDLLEKKKLRSFDGAILLRMRTDGRLVDRFFFKAEGFAGFLQPTKEAAVPIAVDRFFFESR